MHRHAKNRSFFCASGISNQKEKLYLYLQLNLYNKTTMKKEIISNNAPAAIGPYSQAIETGGMVFVSGQLPVDPINGKFVEGGIGALTRRALDNISAILYEAGLTMRDVVKTTVFLTDMHDFDEMNETYASYFGDVAPARSAVEVKKLPKGSKIEIEAIAVK